MKEQNNKKTTFGAFDWVILFGGFGIALLHITSLLLLEQDLKSTLIAVMWLAIGIWAIVSKIGKYKKTKSKE